ncbi:MAG TPA: hypothetical protein VF502_01055 [Stellaceae bacterium]
MLPLRDAFVAHCSDQAMSLRHATQRALWLSRRKSRVRTISSAKSTACGARVAAKCAVKTQRDVVSTRFSPSIAMKNAASHPLRCISIRLSVATFIESQTFRRHRGFIDHESKTEACQGRRIERRGEEGAEEEEGRSQKEGQEEVARSARRRDAPPWNVAAATTETTEAAAAEMLRGFGLFSAR